MILTERYLLGKKSILGEKEKQENVYELGTDVFLLEFTHSMIVFRNSTEGYTGKL